MTRRVTVIPGDGIGPEVIDSACRVLEATGVSLAWDVHEVGVPAIEAGGVPLGDEVLESVRANGVALKGPVSTPVGRVGFKSVNVEIRRALGLYAQARPCRSRSGLATPFSGIDLVVVRSTTEDLYAGVEFEGGSEGATAVIDLAHRLGRGTIPPTAGLSIKFLTEAAARKIVQFAIAYAREHGRRKVAVVHKATVMRATDGVFLEVARELANATPDLEFEEYQVDNLCGQLVRRPADFDVLVMGIQYGDIVSDLGAGLVGGIGVVPGMNVGDLAVMFEPAHGTAPRHANLGRANPTGAILCGVLLLDHLGEHDAARRVEQAIDAVIADGRYVTYDVKGGGSADRPAASTEAMTDAVIEAMVRNRAVG